MAKGARATTTKRNRRALRAKVFGPAHDARTQRLSAKLQEIAAKPRPDQERIMDVDSAEENSADAEAAQEDGSEEMIVDGLATKPKPAQSKPNKNRPSRIEKKIANRKARNSIVFKPTTQQRKRLETKGRKK